MRVAAAGLVDTSRPIRGMPAGASLRSLGYDSVGMDEGWAVCEPQPGFMPGGYKFHRTNADGSLSPVENKTLFPDIGGLVADIHAMGLKAGWYLNPCFSYCWGAGDTVGDAGDAGDVAALAAFGFDSVKLDGCANPGQTNASLWSSLLNATGKAILIEDCHDSPQPLSPISEGGCPYIHTFRSSTDIRNTYGSWVLNADSVEPYASSGRTGPTCWAYPDMLMIGVGTTCAGDTCAGREEPPLPTLIEQRAHYGLWCVLSSPLTLSMDFANRSLVDSVWPVITNTDAIGVNQAWAGSPGGVLYKSPANVTLQHCTPGWAGDKPCTIPEVQIWYKPLSNGRVALFAAVHALSPRNVTVDLANVPGLACGEAKLCNVRDVWAQAPAGTAAGYFVAQGVASHDSVFVILG
jgi:alpha-galactosidase